MIATARLGRNAMISHAIPGVQLIPTRKKRYKALQRMSAPLIPGVEMVTVCKLVFQVGKGR